MKRSVLLAIILIAFAAISRFIPHISNFTPLAAIAIFGAAHISNKKLAFIVPLFAIWFSDLIINNTVYAANFETFTWFYGGFYWQYGSYLLIGLVAYFVFKNSINPFKVIGTSVSASVLFFAISNLGVWLSGTLYPKTVEGLMACYTAGIPFFRATFTSDLLFSGFLFGSYYLITKYLDQTDLKRQVQSITN